MLSCFIRQHELTASPTPIEVIQTDDFNAWYEEQSPFCKNWVTTTKFKALPNTVILVPNEQGQVSKACVGIKSREDFWALSGLSQLLPEGNYILSNQEIVTWGLGAYQYTRYKQPKRAPARLVITEDEKSNKDLQLLEAIYLVRDLINTPTEDLGTEELGDALSALGAAFGAQTTQIVGDDLIAQGYRAIHAVGRASNRAPRLLDLRWGQTHHPKVTLVGKGVCFDTGGLDLKNSAGMLLMKKDMGGAAHVMGLAKLIMAMNLPICLRVLIPAVENAVSGNAYRPGDVIKTRKGITVEVGNTDAEGRLILAEALDEAAREHPDLIIDIATLTGAGRVALGTDVPIFFTNDDNLAINLQKSSEVVKDPLWRLPLYTPYRELIDSPIADITNNGSSSYGGAITAALFLAEFVSTPWIHFDLMAWNLTNRSGRPQGGEAMAIRALYHYLEQRFSVIVG